MLNQDYFRRDRRDGISPPHLGKECTYAEHIVRARGKRTPFTSVSIDRTKIREFGNTLYRLNRHKLEKEKHDLITHEALLTILREVIRTTKTDQRSIALRALQYATRRLEGLVEWNFDVSGVETKDLIYWATYKVKPFFWKMK